jgi:hypothetical protein
LRNLAGKTLLLHGGVELLVVVPLRIMQFNANGEVSHPFLLWSG